MGQLQDPSVGPGLGALNTNIIFLLLGIYGWEYFQSLHVECALICGRLAFRPSVIPYILGRTCLLIFLILLAAGTSPYSRGLSCLPGTLTIASLGNITLGSSSMNFVIRTWVIWKDSRLVHAVLLLLALGQWTMLVVDVTLIRSTDINGTIYSMLFDILVFILSVVGLSGLRSDSPLKRRLRAQGILYFAIAGIVYIPPSVSALLGNLSVYFLGANTALTVSTIVSSRAVRSLHALGTSDSSETLGSNIVLTTQIETERTIVHEGGRHCVDEADRC